MSDQAGNPVAAGTSGEEAAAGAPQSVPVNMYEAEHALVVVAAMPGVMPDDIEVTVEGAQLTIAAALRTPAPKDYLRHEWHYGPYRRTVELPEDFSGPVDARYANGQLALRVERGPGRERQGPVTIQPDA